MVDVRLPEMAALFDVMSNLELSFVFEGYEPNRPHPVYCKDRLACMVKDACLDET